MTNLFSKPPLDDEPESLSGILPSQVIQRLINGGKIISPTSSPISSAQIQPASLDVRLGRKAYQVRASFLPGKFTVDKKIHDWLVREISLDEPTVFGPGEVYIVPLIESLALPRGVYGKGNPKSTTGRLDIFTRLITECGQEFESIERGYSGPLYLEVVSRTFSIVARAGMKLSQVRFIEGRSDVTDTGLTKIAKKEQLVYADDENPLQAQIAGGLKVSVDLQGNGDTVVAYKAKQNAPPIDLAKIGHYDIDEFWEVIHGPRSKGLILEQSAFYILGSWEKISVPPNYAAEMVPFDPSIGEFRIHYAGFFDPGFGHGANSLRGTKAVLEVRAHEVSIVLEDRQLVGRLVYHRMAQEPEKVYGASIGSSYQQQGLALSKQFKCARTTAKESIRSSGPTLAPPELLLER